MRKLAVEQTLPIVSLPPHVKFMMSKAFNPNPQSDPLKNNESREIIEETQKNLFVIKGIIGFEQSSDGFMNVHAPIYEDVHKIPNRKPVLAKAFNYEVPELGIVKDNFLATIYNNLCYIGG